MTNTFFFVPPFCSFWLEKAPASIFPHPKQRQLSANHVKAQAPRQSICGVRRRSGRLVVCQGICERRATQGYRQGCRQGRQPRGAAEQGAAVRPSRLSVQHADVRRAVPPLLLRHRRPLDAGHDPGAGRALPGAAEPGRRRGPADGCGALARAAGADGGGAPADGRGDSGRAALLLLRPR